MFCPPFASNKSLISCASDALLTNDAAIKSNSAFTPFVISSISFGDNAGKFNFYPGTLTVFLLPNLAVFNALHTMSFPTISVTSNSNAPSSTKILAPGTTS